MALDREDWIFMSWDHPLVMSAMEQLTGSKEGSGAIVEGEPGASPLLLETTFILEVTAPPALEADRFLPPSPLRVTVDMTGNTVDPVDFQAPDGRRRGVLDAGETVTNRIQDMIRDAQEHAQQEAESRRQEAVSKMQTALTAELERLKHLADVNDHVHPEELTGLASRITELDRCLTEATLRLDAVRVVVCA